MNAKYAVILDKDNVILQMIPVKQWDVEGQNAIDRMLWTRVFEVKFMMVMGQAEHSVLAAQARSWRFVLHKLAKGFKFDSWGMEWRSMFRMSCVIHSETVSQSVMSKNDLFQSMAEQQHRDVEEQMNEEKFDG